MTAPTSPGVVPSDDVRELVERLRLFADADVMETARDGTFEYNDGVKWSGLMEEAADMLERLANRPSLTEVQSDEH